jgi:hypothetical protein
MIIKTKAPMAEWYTRVFEVHMTVRSWRFESSSGHTLLYFRENDSQNYEDDPEILFSRNLSSEK